MKRAKSNDRPLAW